MRIVDVEALITKNHINPNGERHKKTLPQIGVQNRNEACHEKS